MSQFLRVFLPTIGRNYPRNISVKLFLKSCYWPRRGDRLKVFSVFSSGGHFFSAEPIDFNNFDRGLPEKHFCEIILKSGHWPRKRNCLTDGRADGLTDD